MTRLSCHFLSIDAYGHSYKFSTILNYDSRVLVRSRCNLEWLSVSKIGHRSLWSYSLTDHLIISKIVKKRFGFVIILVSVIVTTFPIGKSMELSIRS